ncbi:MAG: hypothetical protein ACRDFB_08850 [Rhabdochlamydiaceae bacterium]
MGRLIHFDVLSEKNPESVANEDIVYVGKKMAWVLDGATPLSKRNHMNSQSDALWLVSRLHSILLQYEKYSEFDLLSILNKAHELLNREFLESIQNKILPEHELPSSGISIIRWNESNNFIEYAVLGDCEVAIFNGKNDQPTIISDPSLQKLDQEVVNKIYQLQTQKNLKHKDVKDLVLPDLIRNRTLMNKQDGYPVFSASPQPIDRAITGKFTVKTEEAKAILVSDGIGRTVGNLDIYGSWNELLLEGLSKGTQTVMRNVRNFENSDPECIRFPRMSQFDDASIALLTLSFT